MLIQVYSHCIETAMPDGHDFFNLNGLKKAKSLTNCHYPTRVRGSIMADRTEFTRIIPQSVRFILYNSELCFSGSNTVSFQDDNDPVFLTMLSPEQHSACDRRDRNGTTRGTDAPPAPDHRLSPAIYGAQIHPDNTVRQD